MINVNTSILIETNSKFPYVIVGKSYIHPLDDLDFFEEELRSKNYKGKVLLDALLSNGFSHNRFATLDFNGKNFYKASTTIIDKKDVPVSIQNAIYQYFYEHPYLIEGNHILSKCQKYKLINNQLIKKES